MTYADEASASDEEYEEQEPEWDDDEEQEGEEQEPDPEVVKADEEFAEKVFMDGYMQAHGTNEIEVDQVKADEARECSMAGLRNGGRFGKSKGRGRGTKTTGRGRR